MSRVTETAAHGSRLQPTSIQAKKLTVDLMRMEYTYTLPGSPTVNNGNVRTHTVVVGGNTYVQTYGYDGLNRLSSASETSSGNGTWSEEFGDDRFGNRWVSSASPAGLATSFTPVASTNFDSATNRLYVNAAAYDDAGKQTAIGGYAFSYDAENRLKTGTLVGGTTTYSYDADGRRVMKAGPAGGTAYLTADMLGSIRLVTDGDGEIVACHDYLPYGEEIEASLRSRPACYSAADGLKDRFTGKLRDTETGLDYFGARYFSAAQGRFTSPDLPFADQDPSNPQSWNLYSYAHNNPLRFNDPTGRCSEAAGGYTDEGSGLFPGKCSEGQIGGTKPQQVTVGVGQEEANLIMLSMVGDQLSSTHQWATVVSAGGQGAIAAWNLKGLATGGWHLLTGLRGLFGTTEMVAGLYGGFSRAALEAAATAGGDTVKVVTNLTQAPAAGSALSVAVGQGAEALAGTARAGGTTYVAHIPRALIQLMRGAGLVTESTTSMGGAVGTELQFTPNAAEFVVGLFKPIQ